MRRVAWIAGAVLLLSLLSPALPAQAVKITGTTCKTLYSKKVSSGKLYQCQRVRISKKWKLRWGKGTYCKNSSQHIAIATSIYGCKRERGKWVWFKRPVVYPTLRLQDDFAILTGGDVDVETFSDFGTSGWKTGNGTALVGDNTDPDNYLNIAVIDARVKYVPSPFHTVVTMSYLDSGTDTFTIQYDSKDGAWATSRTVTKTNTNTVKTAVFNICDGGFRHRNNGGDIRISDQNDGSEYITDVVMKYLPTGKQTWNVDAYGANPFDESADSDAIQSVLNSTCSGDTVRFTAGTEGVNGFSGYLIDKTIKLIGNSAKDHLTFTSTSTTSNSLFKATPSLLGFVAKLYGKGTMDMSNLGKIDNITLERIDIDGNRQQRKCTGVDGNANGVNDNWGSSDPGDLMEVGNPGTLPGGLSMDGSADTSDALQDYINYPNRWSTNLVVQNLTIRNVECGTALGMIYAAKSTIQDVTVTNSGEHHHTNVACTPVDNDGDAWSWADGMTVGGPDVTVQNNFITNPSDVGIVTFGGKGQKILNNTIAVSSGNYGTFAGIHVQVGAYGNASDLDIEGNTLSNNGSAQCGGMHMGIALSTMTFLAGCTYSYFGTQYGSGTGCNFFDLVESPVTGLCTEGTWCTAWIHADEGHSIILRNNSVTGAQVNYTVGFVDGQLIEENNVSNSPSDTDWETAHSCRGTSITPTDKLALFPSIDGWTEYGLTCWT